MLFAKSTSRPSAKVFAFALAKNVAIFCSMLSIFSLGGKFYWLMDLISHFRPQYFVLIALVMPVIFLLKEKRITAFATIALVVNAIEIVPFYLPKPHTNDLVAACKLKVLTLNVNYENRDFNKILACINKFNPDLFAVEELTPQLDKQLKDSLPAYSYSCSLPNTTPFGIGLFSRVPLANAHVEYFQPNKASIVGEVSFAGKNVFVVATHPTTPLTQALAAENKAQLLAISAEIKKKDETTVLVGDLNATAYCSAYKDAVSSAHLIDTAKGYGLQLSWLRSFPPLCLAIDHCLTTPDLVTDARVIGPDIGSDHWPVYVELQRTASYQPYDLISKGRGESQPVQ
jgi:endonuclease/exonuclease/phosphatase (EEP) superfamily protein YafD